MPDVTGTGATCQVFQTAQGAGAESAPHGGFLWPQTPNIVDFLNFLGTSVEIPTSALPGTSPFPQYALTAACAIVITAPAPVPIIYTLAVYNLATHLLFGMTPDQAGNNFFANARSNKGYSLVNPSTGLVASSSDNGTSNALATPEWATRLTVAQLGYYKTPWGREYLSYAQSYGPTIWGLT